MSFSYRTCVLGGVALAISTATLFATRAGITPLLWLAIAAFAVCTALFLAAMTKVLFGAESFAFLHYQVVAVAATSALLYAMRAPLLPALNLLALTLVIAQAIGRLGCASAGCCHGRPARWGIRYRADQVGEHFAGARLLPVQWIESGALFIIAGLAAARLDDAFVIYTLASAIARFTLELFRGDARRHLAGLSEAQWICVLTAAGVGAWQGGFALLVASVLGLAAIVIARSARIDADALARAVREARGFGASPSQRAGIRISHAITGTTEHYTISAAGLLTPRRARAIARFLHDLAHPDAPLRLVAARRPGIYHVLLGGSR